jgi:circadian clock protein KaiC
VKGQYAVPDERIQTSVPGLGEMIGGGLLGASCAMVVGSSGTGKTLCSISFLVGAARQGLPGLLVSFEERTDQLIRNADGFGWELSSLSEGKLFNLLHVAPSELDLDKHGPLIQRRVEEVGARVVIIDTVSALEDATKDGERAHDYLWAITDYFKRSGVTVVLTYETGPGSGRAGLESRFSFLSDVMIELDLVDQDSEMRRTARVRKMRGFNHDKTIREFFIEPDGLRIGERFGTKGAGAPMK